MTSRETLRSLAAALLLAALAWPALADEENDADWSTRLLHQKALIERAQQAFDESAAAYAKAVAAGEPALRVAALRAARETAAAELQREEEALPDLLARARAAGVSQEVLLPYRYATSPVPVRDPGEAPAAKP